jgi:hypothetical protein
LAGAQKGVRVIVREASILSMGKCISRRAPTSFTFQHPLALERSCFSTVLRWTILALK